MTGVVSSGDIAMLPGIHVRTVLEWKSTSERADNLARHASLRVVAGDTDYRPQHLFHF
jgi:hypothetical protein